MFRETLSIKYQHTNFIRAAGIVAQRTADNLGNAQIHDLKNAVPNLDQFDCVIIGSSLYAGSARKEAKTFPAKNAKTKRC